MAWGHCTLAWKKWFAGLGFFNMNSLKFPVNVVNVVKVHRVVKSGSAWGWGDRNVASEHG